MAYRKTIFTEKKIAERIKEGRGYREGKEYRPWLDVQDFSSSGRSSRLPGWKTGRIHQLFSDFETRYFYLLEWSDSVIDIREQFPLLDREHTQSIAKRLGFKHPVEVKSRNPSVMTTDFMITVISNGRKKYIARTIKPPEKLDNKRTIEKLEIEKIYWEERGIDWGLGKETEATQALARNVEWVHTRYWIEDLKKKNESIENMISDLKKTLQSRKGSVLTILSSLDQEYHSEPGTFIQLFMHLIARKHVMIDMYGNMDFNRMETDMISVENNKSVKELLA